MIFALCTQVTFLRFSLLAISKEKRVTRSVAKREIGLIEMALLALTFFFLFFYEIFLSTLVYILGFFINEKLPFIFIKEFWYDLGLEIILNLILVFILFYLFSFFGKKLRPVFLIKK